MSRVNPLVPSAVGQLVWSPADPNLGIGIVTDVDAPRVHIQFFALQSERIYTTRGPDRAISRYPISAGERVKVKDGEWLTVETMGDVSERLWSYKLDDGTKRSEAELLPKVRDIGAKERLGTLSLAHPEAVRGRLWGWNLAQSGERAGHAAVLGARALWLPHQVDVAARALSTDPVRLLLADEVGLGKTVEAALIYAGLRHEKRAERVLILTPDALAIQWLGEMYRKAHELLVLLDDERIEDAALEHPDLSPFDAYQRMVVSIDKVTNDGALLAHIKDSEWDLVIVDEAHHLKWNEQDGGNAAYRVIEQLAQNSRHLLLLTATPMALDPAEYHALLRLLDSTRFGLAADFQAALVHQDALRDAGRSLQCSLSSGDALTDDEQECLHTLFADDSEDLAILDAFVSESSAKRALHGDALMTSLRDRHGIADFVVRNRRGPVGGLPVRRSEIVGLEASGDQEALLDIGEGLLIDLVSQLVAEDKRHETLGTMLRALWATPEALLTMIRPFSDELAAEILPLVQRVVDAPLDDAGLPTGDTRLRWLVETIRRLDSNEKILVFVESDIAVKALRQSLGSILLDDVAMFHRGLSPRDQDRQVAWFRDPTGPKILLSTEAGGEGRNFQFCSKVVLYDMPWRPATVEQRIGRIDRVGQKNDVHVLAPFFNGGYEAAILKVMQSCIGVLDETVGGIDHQLEYVSGRLAALVLEEAGADEWKELYRKTADDIKRAKDRIESGVDPILDFSSFSKERADRIFSAIPDNLEVELQNFLQRYADHTRLEVHSKGDGFFGVEGAPSAAGRNNHEMSYVATFKREKAIDHEEVEFLSFGHPLVEDALEWARDGGDVSAALALCRGFQRDGSIFLWHFAWEVSEDAADAIAYLEGRGETFAIDEGGNRQPTMENLWWDPERPLERMDHKPLKQAQERWAAAVEQNYAVASELAESRLDAIKKNAQNALLDSLEQRRRRLRRARARVPETGATREALLAELEKAEQDLEREEARLSSAIEQSRPRLLVAMAVRLMKSARVSG